MKIRFFLFLFVLLIGCTPGYSEEQAWCCPWFYPFSNPVRSWFVSPIPKDKRLSYPSSVKSEKIKPKNCSNDTLLDEVDVAENFICNASTDIHLFTLCYEELEKRADYQVGPGSGVESDDESVSACEDVSDNHWGRDGILKFNWQDDWINKTADITSRDKTLPHRSNQTNLVKPKKHQD